MDRIEFIAKVDENGVIRIPDEFAREVEKGKSVHVTVSSESKKRLTVRRMEENPIHAPGFKPLDRDELYDRK